MRTTLTLLALTVALPSLGHAYTKRALSGCSEISFAQPPHVVLHTSEMGGIDFIEALKVMDALADAHAQIDGAGINISIASSSLSSDPFVFKSWFYDAQPTIHVGFTDDTSKAPGGAFWRVDGSCNIEEAHIYFKDETIYDWSFNEPEGEGEPYYMAGMNPIGAPSKYFRASYMHELLHALGLAHSNDGLAMLNGGVRPWMRGDFGEKIKPLADDLRGLRDLYGVGADRLEVKLVNSWFTPDTTSTDTYPSADGDFLCTPSVGTGWDDWDEPLCALSPTTTVCPGDTLRVRVAVLNLSTEGVDVNLRLWLSEDDVWDGFVIDRRSSDLREFSLTRTQGSRQGRLFEVPDNLVAGQTYHVILRARATGQTSGGVVTDWIPMRGTVTVDASCP